MLRRVFPASIRYPIAAWLLDAPIAWRLIRRVDPKLRHIGRVDRDTGVVIEGFPRSANSYARIAFLLANPDVEVCSHTHSYRTVTRAIELGVPVIVLIRDPEEAIASSTQYEGGVKPIVAIRGYRKFHRHIARIPSDRLVLADFDEVVRDFGSVIARCNAELGTSFGVYERTPENEAKIRDVLGTMQEAAIPAELREVRSGLPERARADAASRVLDSLSASERDALASAKAEYESLRTRFIAPRPGEATAGKASA
jgi:hypothetical protein